MTPRREGSIARGSSRYQPYSSTSRNSHPTEPHSPVVYPRSITQPYISLNKAKTPYWHTVHGLIVNVSGAGLPHGVTSSLDDDEPSSLRHPRLLHDGNVFLPFYPKDSLDMGALFNAIDLSGHQLAPLIQKNTNGLWALDYVTQVKWDRLESSLKDVADVLLRAYRTTEKFDMPALVSIKFPHTYGYKEAGTFDGVYRRCRNAIHGFKVLSAYVSFAFAIWLKSSPDDAFSDAAYQLQHSGLQLSTLTMVLLQTSIVTRFSYGLRVGGVIDPHTTHWGRVFHRIARANVPLWLLWGNDSDRMCVDPIIRFVYYPPAYALDIAKARYIVDASENALVTLAFDPGSVHTTESTESRSAPTMPAASIESYGETVWDITSSEAEPGFVPNEYSPPEDSTRDVDDTTEYSDVHIPSSSQLPTVRVFVQMTLPSIEAYLRIRHGYSINHVATSPSHVDLYSPDALAEDSNKPCLYLLYKDTTTLSPSTMLGVNSWWNVMANVSDDPTRLPSEWDMRIDSDILSRQSLFSLTVANTPCGKRCYILSSPKRSLSDWAIATTSPSALLSIYRQSDIITIQAAAKSLLDLGVPFRTVVSRPLRSCPSRQSHLVANPLLEAMTAVQGAPHDFYPSYEGLRDSILQTRVGRNALLRGGILWRLSKHIVPIDTVLTGPTYANELVASDNSTSYYDDVLCQSTAELIVGVFRFEGTTRGIHSYWPRYETFTGSGYDGGQWLPDAERWYVHHLEGLQSGGQPLKASKTWTAHLKRNVKTARPILEASDRLAESFIEKYMSVATAPRPS